MNIIISGRNVEVTDALRDAVEQKVSKLSKYFEMDTEVQATLSVEKNRQIIEVTIPMSGTILRAEEATEDMYSSIDRVVDKLVRQLKKYKTKLEKRNVKYDTIRFENIPTYEPKDDYEDSKIVKTKRFPVKPMGSEEAVLQMELIGHNFFVFANADTDEVNVVYKRNDGQYGLIEPEF
ncbi:ribosome-associated translation inhibitor RaiA [Serpentinicella sp. ANB-PHB4]|uniref:ribosome hibernation-promoting factor, HPF/YfiA family n=1 Tax=Serpentinicella sp. ANB-PHB4 TaxID=3074076 RepID=UPI00285FFFD8|nr:ribosome-associated translation inhibitor RaiA [Serpentinicella sp. ANB-PHB4]MDR5659798.1 ribosome-associated translation inhibitor RaiA [Serpentinicella sp. ANB-PHB4]